MKLKENLRAWLPKARLALAPTILSTMIFFLMYYVFGSENTVIGVFATLSFLRYRSMHNHYECMIKNFFIYLVMAAAAFLAALNLPLCILANAAALFWIGNVLIDEYNPTNYFPSGMALIFFQISPVTTPAAFLNRVLALLATFVIFFLMTVILSRKNAKKDPLADYMREGFAQCRELIRLCESQLKKEQAAPAENRAARPYREASEETQTAQTGPSRLAQWAERYTHEAIPAYRQGEETPFADMAAEFVRERRNAQATAPHAERAQTAAGTAAAHTDTTAASGTNSCAGTTAPSEAIRNAKDSSRKNPVLKDPAPEKSVREDSVPEGSAMESSAIESSAMENSAMENSAMKDSSFGEREKLHHALCDTNRNTSDEIYTYNRATLHTMSGTNWYCHFIAVFQVINYLTQNFRENGNLEKAKTMYRDFLEEFENHVPDSGFHRLNFRVKRPDLRSFRLRFALRLMITVTPCLLFARATSLPNAYWLVISVFFMMIPYTDHTMQRVRSRIVGTLGGIVLCLVLFTLFPGFIGRVVIMILANFLIYQTSGYGTRVTFITCSALAISTINTSVPLVLVYRLLYTLIGALIAIAANRLIFPIRMKKQVLYLMELIRNTSIEMRDIMRDPSLDTGRRNKELDQRLVKSYLLFRRLEDMYQTLPEGEEGINYDEFEKTHMNFMAQLLSGGFVPPAADQT